MRIANPESHLRCALNRDLNPLQRAHRKVVFHVDFIRGHILILANYLCSNYAACKTIRSVHVTKCHIRIK